MIKHEPYFILRTPLFSYQTAEVLDTPALIQIFSQPAFQEAIYLASPVLYRKLASFLDSSMDEADVSRTKLSLQKYLLRLSRRSTPFALFAGITMGEWSDQTNAVLPAEIVRHTRLDADYVSQLVLVLLRRPEVRDVVKFFPNSTLYNVIDKLRYIEHQVINHRRAFSLSNIDYQLPVHWVLEHAKDGKDRNSLASKLTDSGWEYEQALSLVEEMIESQLLVSELEINLTDLDYFSSVIKVLKKYDVCLPALDEILNQLETIDRQRPDNNLKLYPRLIDNLQQFTRKQVKDNYLQVDVCRKGTVELNRKLGEVIQKGTEFLSRILPVKENRSMTAFRKAFYERYGHKTVDLCIVLDPEIGIGYPVRYTPHLTESSLLKDILFPETEHPAFLVESSFQRFVLRKYSEALIGKKPITLIEEELTPFLKSIKLPASLYAFVSIFPKSSKGGNDFDILFNGAYGPSAATLIARFCHLNTDLTERVHETLRKEEQSRPEAIFAEIIHANEARIGNISTRPVLRSYEIPILAKGGVDLEHTIPVGDLTISFSGDRLILRSKKLNREIIPRLSSAHNYTNDTISVYRFLCDLQYEGIQSSVSWDWGVLSQAPYLPTVRMGDFVLSPAKWRLSEEEWKAIKRTTNLRSMINNLRENHRICRYVLVGERDHKMAIDFENEDHLPLFQKLMETTNVIEECLSNGRDFVFHDEAGMGYANELIVPLDNVGFTQNEKHSSHIVRHDHGVVRNFTLGSEWLYYKIYCSTNAADQILRQFVRPLSSSLLNSRVIDRWFFIRYSDPDSHIRLRFHGNGSFYNHVIERFNQFASAFLDLGLITSVNTDVYSRELERYGPENIEASEQLFFIDSDCIVDLLETIDDQVDLPWQLGLALADQWFSNFDIPLTERKDIILELQQQFFKELRVDQMTKKSLASKLRKNRQSIELILNGKGLPEAIGVILSGRVEKMNPTAQAIRSMAKEGKLSVSLRDLIKSYIHLSINRLVSANQRHHEMVLYDFLYQYYHSKSRKSCVS